MFVPFAVIETCWGAAFLLPHGLFEGDHGTVNDKSLLWLQAADRCAAQFLNCTLLSTNLGCEFPTANESPKLGHRVPSAQASVTATGGVPAVSTEPLEACPRHRET